MTNPKCAACGHVNRVGAAACEMCDARLGAPPPHAEESRGAGESSAPSGDAHGFGASADIPSPPFKGMGDVVSPTLEVYRKNFLLVGILVAVATPPATLLQYGVLLAMSGETGAPVEIVGGGLLTASTATWLLTGLLSFAGTALLSGALVYAVVDIQRT